MQAKHILLTFLATGALAACDDAPAREDGDPDIGVAGFYVLNEGSYGGNNASIDCYNTESGAYSTDVYTAVNPTVVLELGDSGNDIAVHNGRLYCVLTGSHKVEIMEAGTCKRIGQVEAPSPRSIAFDGGYAYVSCLKDPNNGNTGKGCIMRFNLASLKVEGIVGVGYGPEEMVVADGRLYVANSYSYPNFDNTISIIDLATFALAGTITVAPNMHHLRLDSDGNMWVSVRGNYYDVAPDLYYLPREPGGFGTPISTGIPCTNFVIKADELYYYATIYDAEWNTTNEYGTVSTKTGKKSGSTYIGNPALIQTPYAIAAMPDSEEVIIADARNYISSGMIYCFDATDGSVKWQASTGICPGHIAFF